MFERPHHQRIARVLESLKASELRRAHALFGGGTAIVLSEGEYRESVDIDFICDSAEGYRELRSRVHAGGMDALLDAPIPLVREPRIDQYGIRCAFLVDAQPVKFEIIFEGRVALSDPGPQDQICGVAALTLDDRVATKLMANSDRWADDSVMSRDLIDLAMLTDTGTLSAAGVGKAVQAYGESVVVDLGRAKDHLLTRQGRLQQCMRNLQVRVPLEDLQGRIARLRIERPTASSPR